MKKIYEKGLAICLVLAVLLSTLTPMVSALGENQSFNTSANENATYDVQTDSNNFEDFDFANGQEEVSENLGITADTDSETNAEEDKLESDTVSSDDAEVNGLDSWCVASLTELKRIANSEHNSEFYLDCDITLDADLRFGPGNWRSADKYFNLNGHTINLNGHHIILKGYGDRNTRLFIYNNPEVSGKEAKIINGKSTNGGAFYAECGRDTVLEIGTKGNGEVIVEGCTADDSGGAVYVDKEAKLTVGSLAVIQNNKARYGGAIDNFGSTTINGGCIKDNIATEEAGAIYQNSQASDKTVLKGNGSITGNKCLGATGTGDAGAIMNEKVVEIGNCTIKDNYAKGSCGGGIDSLANTEVIFSGSATIMGNMTNVEFNTCNNPSGGTNNNLYLENNAKISYTNEFLITTRVYVSTIEKVDVGKKIQIADCALNENCFVPDTDKITLENSGGKAYLVPMPCTEKYLRSVCEENGGIFYLSDDLDIASNTNIQVKKNTTIDLGLYGKTLNLEDIHFEIDPGVKLNVTATDFLEKGDKQDKQIGKISYSGTTKAAFINYGILNVKAGEIENTNAGSFDNGSIIYNGKSGSAQDGQTGVLHIGSDSSYGVNLKSKDTTQPQIYLASKGKCTFEGNIKGNINKDGVFSVCYDEDACKEDASKEGVIGINGENVQPIFACNITFKNPTNNFLFTERLATNYSKHFKVANTGYGITYDVDNPYTLKVISKGEHDISTEEELKNFLENSNTINDGRLISDINLTSSYTSKGTKTLDMNSYSISTNQSNSITVDSGASMTLKGVGSSITKNGSGEAIIVNGTLNISDIGVENGCTGQNGIEVSDNGKLTVESGIIKAEQTSVIVESGATCTLNNGEIVAKRTGVQNKGTFNMTGGKIYNEDTEACAGFTCVENSGTSANFNMTGGEIYVTNVGKLVSPTDTNYGVKNLSSATFTMGTDTNLATKTGILASQTKDESLLGTTQTLNRVYAVYNEDATFEMKGSRVTNSDVNPNDPNDYLYKAEGNTTIKCDAEYGSEENGDMYGLYNFSSKGTATTKIVNGDIRNFDFGIFNLGTLNIYDCYISDNYTGIENGGEDKTPSDKGKIKFTMYGGTIAYNSDDDIDDYVGTKFATSTDTTSKTKIEQIYLNTYANNPTNCVKLDVENVTENSYIAVDAPAECFVDSTGKLQDQLAITENYPTDSDNKVFSCFKAYLGRYVVSKQEIGGKNKLLLVKNYFEIKTQEDFHEFIKSDSSKMKNAVLQTNNLVLEGSDTKSQAEIDSYFTVGRDCSLDMNGKDITLKNGDNTYVHITVQENVRFNVYNSGYDTTDNYSVFKCAGASYPTQGGAFLNKGILDFKGENTTKGESINNLRFEGLKARNGGAIYNLGQGELDIASVDFTQNTAINNGGAIYNEGTLYVFSNSKIGDTENKSLGNTANNKGAGIYTVNDVSLSGMVTIWNNTSNSVDSNLYFDQADKKINFEDFNKDSKIGISTSASVAAKQQVVISYDYKDGDKVGEYVSDASNNRIKEVKVDADKKHLVLGVDGVESIGEFCEPLEDGEVYKLVQDIGTGTDIEKLTEPLVISNSITIDLNGYEMNLNGQNIVNNSNNLTFTDSKAVVKGKLTGGKAVEGGAIYNNSGKELVLTNGVVICGNEAQDVAGAIYNKGALTVENANIKENKTTGKSAEAGAIFNAEGAKFEFANGEINQNVSVYGGGISNYGEMRMSGGIISGNTATSEGGAIYVAGKLTEINAGTIIGNISKGSGGASALMIDLSNRSQEGKVKIIGTARITENKSENSIYGAVDVYYAGCGAVTVGGEAVISGNTSSNSTGGDNKENNLCIELYGDTTQSKNTIGFEKDEDAPKDGMSVGITPIISYIAGKENVNDITVSDETYIKDYEKYLKVDDDSTYVLSSGDQRLSVSMYLGITSSEELATFLKDGKITQGDVTYTDVKVAKLMNEIEVDEDLHVNQTDPNFTLDMCGYNINLNEHNITIPKVGNDYAEITIKDTTVESDSTTTNLAKIYGGKGEYGGAFNITGGFLNVCDVKITENTATKYGGGVYNNGGYSSTQDATLACGLWVGGSAQIVDNYRSDGTTADNVYLPTGKKIKIDSDYPVTENMKIGIMTEKIPTEVDASKSTDAYIDFLYDVGNYAKYFIADNPECLIGYFSHQDIKSAWNIGTRTKLVLRNGHFSIKSEADFEQFIQESCAIGVLENGINLTKNLTVEKSSQGTHLNLNLNGNTLDLGGYTLTISNKEHCVDNSRKFAIFDTSSGKAGKVTNGNIRVSGVSDATGNSSFTLESGTLCDVKLEADNDRVGGTGGRIYIKGGTITGNSRINNKNGILSIDGGIISGNNVSGSNGTIYNGKLSELTVKNGVIKDNVATNGGAIYNDGKATIIDSKITGNNADKGGAVYNNGTLTINNSLLEKNTANNGGAVYNADDANTDIIDATIKGNTASTNAGGIDYSGGELTFCGTTYIEENTQGTTSTPSNIVIGKDQMISFGTGDSKPMPGMDIGVSKKELTNLTSDITSGEDNTDFSGYVKSDDTKYKVSSTIAETGNWKVQLVKDCNIYRIDSSVSDSKGGTISPLGESLVEESTSITYVAYATNTDYRLVYFLVDGMKKDGDLIPDTDSETKYIAGAKEGSYTFEKEDINDNHEIQAVFKKIYTITVDKTSGATDAAISVHHEGTDENYSDKVKAVEGDRIEVLTTDSDSWSCAEYWKVSSGSNLDTDYIVTREDTSGTLRHTFEVPADVQDTTLTSVFEKLISVTGGGEIKSGEELLGTVQLNGAVTTTALEGQYITVTATPTTDTDGVPITAVTKYDIEAYKNNSKVSSIKIDFDYKTNSFIMPYRAKTADYDEIKVNVTFEKKQRFAIKAATSTNGKVDVSSSSAYAGQIITITANGNFGYRVDSTNYKCTYTNTYSSQTDIKADINGNFIMPGDIATNTSVTVSAEFVKEEPYKVYYYCNEEYSGTMPANQLASKIDANKYEVTIASATIIRPGYSFASWTDASGKSYSPGLQEISSSLQLYAQWTKECKVIYTANATDTTITGTPPEDNNSYVVGNEVTIKWIDDESVAESSILKKQGYTFTGWGKDQATYKKGPNYTVTQSDVDNGTATFTALWDTNKYTITFDMQGHGSSIATQSVKFGDCVTEPATPTEIGYEFGGWYKAKECADSNKWNFSIDTVKCSQTLYAKWTPKEYTIEYKRSDATDTNVVFSDMSKIVTKSDITKMVDLSGYIDNVNYSQMSGLSEKGVSGWCLSTNSDNLITEISVGTVPADETTLTVYLMVKKYTVTFYNVDGTFVTSTNNVSHGQKLATPTEPTKPEPGDVKYGDFLGWYVDGGNTKWDFSNGVTSDLNLIAKFNINTNTVKFDLQGKGSTQPDDQVIAYGQYVTEPDTPSANGYQFDNWYKEAKCQNKWNFGKDAVTTNTTLYAKWNVVNYTITYVTNGGDPLPQGTYNIESPDIYLGNTTKAGADFVGWYDNPELEGSPITTIKKGSYGNKTFYAKWNVHQFTVDFDVQNHGEAPQQQIINYGDKVATPTNPVADGYTFGGWYKETSFAQPWYFETYTVTTNTTLYAKWTTNTYTIKFDTNGGDELTPKSYTVETETFDLPTPTNTGYIFKGWFDKDGNKVERINKGTYADMKLTASWEIEEYTITYISNGGTELSKQKYNVVSDTIILPDKDVMTKSGAIFEGWYEDESFETAKIINIPKGSHEDKTLYAKWIVDKVVVKFDVQDHGIAPPDQTLYYGDKVSTPTTPIAEGYNLDGWFKEQECKNMWYFEEYVVTTDTTLYAKWSEQECTVTFDVQGHGVAPQAQTVNYNDKVATPTEPTAVGYTFGGWFSDSSFKQQWDFANSTVKADITLYAKWTVDTYTITYETNGGKAIATEKYNIETETFFLPTAVKEGSGFNGWYDNPQFSGSPIEEIEKGTYGDKTLYAKWKENEITVIFDVQGHGTAPQKQTVNYNDKVAIPTEPTADGYTFEGWFSDSSFEQPWYFENYTVKVDMKLYAKWALTTYTIIYETNSEENIPQKQYSIETETFSLPVITKANSIFKGWYDSSDNSYTEITKGTSKNLTLYAKWEDVTYTIKASAHGGGFISPSGEVKVKQSKEQVFTATSSDMYKFTKFIIDGQIDYADSSYTFTDVTANHTIEAVFEATQSEWQQAADGSWKYSENGKLVTGWRKNLPGWDNMWFYFGNDGIMKTGWQGNIPNWEGKTFYFEPNGVMVTGWKDNIPDQEGKTFYFNSDGTMAVGWHGHIPGWNSWFYFDERGEMLTGWHYLNWSQGNNWFIFKSNGEMYRNVRLFDKFTIDRSGALM